MKKTILMIASISMLSIVFYSCNKENDSVQTAENKNASSRMIFESVKEYENLLEDPNKTESLVNELSARFGTYNEAARLSTFGEDTLYPEFLQKILNDDHIAQISKWLIKVDALSSQVLVLETKYSEQYDDLAKSNLSNKNISVYSCNDNVLEILQSEVSNQNARVEGLFCKGVSRNLATAKEEYVGESGSKTINGYSISGGLYLTNAIDYNSYGIYFKLGGSTSSYIMFEGQLYDFTSNQLKLNCNGWWTENCKKENNDKNEYSVTNSNSITRWSYCGTSNISYFDITMKGIYLKSNGTYFTTSPYHITRN